MATIQTPRGDLRIFRGDETLQVQADDGIPAIPTLWYWEPADYDGDVLWSDGYETEAEAQRAALGHW